LKGDSVKANLLAIVLALVVAIIGTIMHQSVISPEIPIGLILSLAMVLFAATEVRTLSRKKLPALVFSIFLAATVFFAAQDLTGDKLIPANDVGLIWSYGSIGIAILIGVFPRIEQRN